MPYRGDVFAKGQYYHIYNRGAGKGLLFFNPANYEYCLRLVKQYYQEYGAGVIAYCLMPNHYHFFLRQDGDQPLSRFINVLFNAYVQGLNRQQNRTGTLFEGRFRQVCVDRSEYLAHLCRYIHLNPLKGGLVSRLEDWPYSNYLEWIGQREGSLKDGEFIHNNFSSPESYRLFVIDGQDELRAREHIEKYFLD